MSDRVRGAVLDDVVIYPSGTRVVRRGILFETPAGDPLDVMVIYTELPRLSMDPSPEPET